MDTSLSLSLPEPKVDFVLITALPEELDAVLDKLPGWYRLPPGKDDIRTYYEAYLPVTFADASTGKYRIIVICLLGMGRVQAVAATGDAIHRWHPRYVVLVGIAGGIADRNIQIGDILIADQIVDYEIQKLTQEGPEVRWEVHRADARLLDACNNIRDDSWMGLIKVKRPGRGITYCQIGQIASGDKVVAFGDVFTKYRAVWPKLIGVEMEASGVLTAAFQSTDKPGFLMVRGVSDLADINKDSSGVKKWRLYASDVAASFTIALLRSGPIPLSERTLATRTKRVQIILDGEFTEFTSNGLQDIISDIAALLGIHPNEINILKVLQGSILIIIEMPEPAANRLYEMAIVSDRVIIDLGIKSIQVEYRTINDIADKARLSPEQRLIRPGGKYLLKMTSDQNYYFSLTAENNAPILISEIYATRIGAENGIESVRVNSSKDDRYNRKKSYEGKYYFVLVAANNEVIGNSEMYSSESSMENGIAAVKRVGPSAPVKDQT